MTGQVRQLRDDEAEESPASRVAGADCWIISAGLGEVLNVDPRDVYLMVDELGGLSEIWIERGKNLPFVV